MAFSMVDPNSDSFYSGALARISSTMIVLAVIAALALWLRYGWRLAAGFACGAIVSYLNFHWLTQVVNGFAERVTQAGRPQSAKGIVLRFVARYVLMAVAACVIFSVSRASLYGLFVGLFLPVAAIACEAAYEAYVALARGI
jgi:Na+/H+-translocating membrane pyrophosphatase